MRRSQRETKRKYCDGHNMQKQGQDGGDGEHVLHIRENDGYTVDPAIERRVQAMLENARKLSERRVADENARKRRRMEQHFEERKTEKEQSTDEWPMQEERTNNAFPPPPSWLARGVDGELEEADSEEQSALESDEDDVDLNVDGEEY